MGLKSNYVLGNDSLEIVHEEAYLKIVSVTAKSVDYEFFESVKDPEHPEIDQRLSWITRLENDAVVYVWTDIAARNNRAAPIHWFSFTFDYDLASEHNIFEQAYKKLHTLFENSIDCNE